MNTYLRILIAAMASLLIHIALIIGVIHQMKLRPHDKQSVFQVALNLPLNKPRFQTPPQLETTLFKIRKPSAIRAKQTVTPKPDIPKPTQTAAMDGPLLGNVDWHSPPTYQRNEIMNALQLTQLAHQRESQVTAVLSGLSAIASQLRPIITDSIVCTQQVDNNIDCIPELKENERLLIIQFFNLALQGHRLGIIQNPVRMDFGAALGVSLMLARQKSD